MEKVHLDKTRDPNPTLFLCGTLGLLSIPAHHCCCNFYCQKNALKNTTMTSTLITWVVLLLLTDKSSSYHCD